MTEQLILRASSSTRWMSCSGSVKAEHGLPDVQTPYSIEGTKAHDIAAKILQGQILHSSDEAVNNYVEYINQLYTNLSNGQLYVEVELDMSKTIPNAKGTADAVLFDDAGNIHIVDFKYGMGNKIDAVLNYQLFLYGVGVVDKFHSYNFQTITMHIVQPRINNIQTWTIEQYTYKGLTQFIKSRAEAALSPFAPRTPSVEACKFCKAKPTCRALNNTTLEIINLLNTNLSQQETKFILDNSKVITNFIETVENKITNKLLNGENFPGYILSTGKSMRKFKPEAEELLIDLLGEQAFKKSIIGITEAKKLLSKSDLDALTYKPEGKPKLVKDSDPASDFDLLVSNT